MEQLLRRQTFSWKTTSKKGGGRGSGWTAAQVIGEALRQGDRFPHVERPLPPTILRLPCQGESTEGGDAPLTIASLMAEVDRVAKAARIVDVLGRTRRLPPTTSVLCSDVVSTPWQSADIQTDPDLRKRTDAFFRDALAWIVKDIERRGGRVIAAVVHYDESQAHMHVLSVAEHGLARDLHPGYVAKAAVLDRARGPDGKGDIPASAYHEANEAYTAATSELLDRFYQGVAVHHGLDRRSATPVRRREWLEIQLERPRGEASRLEARHDELGRGIEDRENAIATLDARIAEIGAQEDAANERAQRAQAEARESEANLSQITQRCADGETELEELIGRWRHGRGLVKDLRDEHTDLSAKVERMRTEPTDATESRDAALEAATGAEAVKEEALKAIGEREAELAEWDRALVERERAVEEDRAALQRRKERVAKRTSRASELLVSLQDAHDRIDSQQQWVDRATGDLDTTLVRMGHALTTSLAPLLESADDPVTRELLEGVLDLGMGFADAARALRERAPGPIGDLRRRVALMQRDLDALTPPDPTEREHTCEHLREGLSEDVCSRPVP